MDAKANNFHRTNIRCVKHLILAQEQKEQKEDKKQKADRSVKINGSLLGSQHCLNCIKLQKDDTEG
jgi:hypothetical protein